jgi:8-hydroxy-5-deazaflavin:NADPH oxidoreductase
MPTSAQTARQHSEDDMNIAVLGTGHVGRTIGARLAGLGHHVGMGSRSAANDTAAAWVATTGGGSSHGTFADVTGRAEMVFNCTSGIASLDALRAAGAANLGRKVIVDVANPLDLSQGMPPTLSVCNTDSLGEQIQREFPEARVVKALNTVNALVMVEPGRVPGDHDVFICGEDAGAKAAVAEVLRSFGWAPSAIVDLGPISSSRGTEMYLPLWLRLQGALGTADLNIKVVHRPRGAVVTRPG